MGPFAEPEFRSKVSWPGALWIARMQPTGGVVAVKAGFGSVQLEPWYWQSAGAPWLWQKTAWSNSCPKGFGQGNASL